MWPPPPIDHGGAVSIGTLGCRLDETLLGASTVVWILPQVICAATPCSLCPVSQPRDNTLSRSRMVRQPAGGGGRRG